MTLASTNTIDRIEVLENGVIQVRQAQVITDSGNEIARNFSRWVLSPGDDVSTQDPKVKAIATAIWTEAVVSAYEASVAQQKQAGV
jgi:urease accessory protein UreE